jgi:hypothetical protein
MRLSEVFRVLVILVIAYIAVMLILYSGLEDEGLHQVFSIAIGVGLSSKGLENFPQFAITAPINYLTTPYLLLTYERIDISSIQKLVQVATTTNADVISCSKGGYVSAYVSEARLELVVNASMHSLVTDNCAQTNIVPSTCLLIKKSILQSYFDKFTSWDR